MVGLLIPHRLRIGVGGFHVRKTAYSERMSRVLDCKCSFRGTGKEGREGGRKEGRKEEGKGGRGGGRKTSQPAEGLLL